MKISKLGLGIVLGAAMAFSAPSMAMSNDDDNSSKTSADSGKYEKGKKAAMAGRYDEAIGLLNEVVKASPDNADAYNMLGYSHRKKGDYANSFKFYERALKIDPEHKGAHEYIGQAYLESKNLPKAKWHLQRLDDICTWGCEEYDSLKRAVEGCQSGKAPSGYKLDDEQG